MRSFRAVEEALEGKAVRSLRVSGGFEMPQPKTSSMRLRLLSRFFVNTARGIERRPVRAYRSKKRRPISTYTGVRITVSG